MFEQMLLPSGGTQVGRNTLIAFAGQLSALAIATVMMMYFDVLPLPLPQPAIPLYLTPPAPPPPPAAATHPALQTARVEAKTFHLPVPTAPASVPQPAAILADAPPSLQNVGAGDLSAVSAAVPGGVPGGSLNGILGAFPPSPAAAIAESKPAAPVAPAQIRVGGEVQAARLTHEVVPVYPVIARQARVQGTVRLSAAIAPDGTVKDLHLLNGSPLLVAAAEDAVKQWTYQPTYLNGKPVEVLTEIDVRFTLG